MPQRYRCRIPQASAVRKIEPHCKHCADYPVVQSGEVCWYPESAKQGPVHEWVKSLGSQPHNVGRIFSVLLPIRQGNGKCMKKIGIQNNATFLGGCSIQSSADNTHSKRIIAQCRDHFLRTSGSALAGGKAHAKAKAAGGGIGEYLYKLNERTEIIGFSATFALN